jgi:signal transduction histidine kinase/HAMP domain-containing protein
MRLSLKAKLTALISLLVMAVVLVTSTLYVSSLIERTLEEVQSKAEYVANEVHHQAEVILAASRLPPGVDPEDFTTVRTFVQQKLAADPGLTSLMESAIGYSPTIYFVAITDAKNIVMVHNDPSEIGEVFPMNPSFSHLLKSGIARQLRLIYGPPQVLEVDLPLQMGDHPLTVRVGISNLFLPRETTPQLRQAVFLSVLAMFFSTLTAGVLSFLVLRPLESISRSVDQIARGEFSQPVKVNRTDEWGILSSKLNLLGEQIRGEKAAFTKLKENLDQLFSKLADGLMLFDNQDKLLLATPAVARFLGRPITNMLHQPAVEVFGADTPLDRTLRDVFLRRRAVPSELIDIPGGNKDLRVSLSVQFVGGESESVGALVTLRDPTTRAELESQINLAAKMAAIGRLTSGVAHEVKNPLNAMVLQLEILKTKLADQGAQVKPQLDVLSAEVRRLDRVVKTFLDFTRPVELRPVETNLPELVQDVFTLAGPHARQNQVLLKFDSNGGNSQVRVDRDLMKQVLLNLVINGCQSMPAGGELKVTSRHEPNRVELEIQDHGVGIPPEVRQRIFSLFYTTKPNGTGVGLAMAFRVIQLHNGTIEFTSEVNQGTTFRITLPA